MTDEALTSAKLRVCVLNINPGVVTHEFLGSMLGLVSHDVSHERHISLLLPMVAGGLAHIYRNRVIEAAIAAQDDHPWDALLFIDSDMKFDGDILDRLLPYLSPERPCVAAVYVLMTDHGIVPSICYESEDGNGVIRMQPISVHEMPENELVECDATGAGFMLLHRSLIEEMLLTYGSPMPWFETEIHNGIIYGEDYTFGKRIQKLGYKTYVHTGIEAEHVAKKTILSLDVARQVEAKQ